jgi:hypothetical protein
VIRTSLQISVCLQLFLLYTDWEREVSEINGSGIKGWISTYDRDRDFSLRDRLWTNSASYPVGTALYSRGKISWRFQKISSSWTPGALLRQSNKCTSTFTVLIISLPYSSSSSPKIQAVVHMVLLLRTKNTVHNVWKLNDVSSNYNYNYNYTYYWDTFIHTIKATATVKNKKNRKQQKQNI